MIHDLIHLFVDRSCIGCGTQLISQESHICLHCLSQIEPTNFHLRPQDNELYQRNGGRISVKDATSLFYFDKAGRLQKLLMSLKYHDLPRIGHYLGRLMAEYLDGPTLWADVEAIVPIPLHWTKQIQRGYNQSEQIALGISQVTGIPVREDLLIRNRKTQSQAKKSGAKRWTNVSGAFQAALHLPSRILLVDDVITTGATIVAAAQAFEDRVDALSITSVALTRRN